MDILTKVGDKIVVRHSHGETRTGEVEYQESPNLKPKLSLIKFQKTEMRTRDSTPTMPHFLSLELN